MMKYIYKIIIIYICLLIILTNNVFAMSEKLSIEELKNYLVKDIEEDGALKSSQIQGNKIEIVLKNDYAINIYYNNENQFIVEQEFDNSSKFENVKAGIYGLTLLPFSSFEALAQKNGVDTEKAHTYTTYHGGMASFLSIGLEEDMKPNVVAYLDDYFDNETMDELNDNCDFYTINWSKEKADDKIIIKSDLTIKDDADFGKFEKSVRELTGEIAEEDADLVVKIKVGETYKIKSDKKISGYYVGNNEATNGEKIIEIDDDYTQIKGLNVGVASGQFMLGENINGQGEYEYSTFYVEVSENKNNTQNKTEDTKNKNTKDETITGKAENGKKDQTVVKEDKLPQSGADIIIYVLIILLIIFAIIAYKRYNKYDN